MAGSAGSSDVDVIHKKQVKVEWDGTGVNSEAFDLKGGTITGAYVGVGYAGATLGAQVYCEETGAYEPVSGFSISVTAENAYAIGAEELAMIQKGKLVSSATEGDGDYVVLYIQYVS